MRGFWRHMNCGQAVLQQGGFAAGPLDVDRVRRDDAVKEPCGVIAGDLV